ncbi:hypothetical protein BJX99DRAFT_96942 [Aspergillus californicus]
MIVFEITRIIYLAKHSEPTTVYISQNDQNDQKSTSNALFLCILYFVPFFFTAFLFFSFFFCFTIFVDQIKGKQQT